MKDFLDAHTPPSGVKPKLTRSRPSIPAISPKKAPKPASSTAPDWLSDFGPVQPTAPSAPASTPAPAPTSRPARPEPKAAESEPKKKPDWMSDFEG
jgi:hypothetical protein